MQKVKVNKSKLLETLKENRQKHIEEYDEAIYKYRHELIDAFKDKLKRAKNFEDVSHTVTLDRPQSFRKNYDEAITLIEWNVADEIELEYGDFRQFVLDEWSWSNAFKSVTAMYLSEK